MSTEADEELGAVKLDVEESRQGLWGKTKQGFRYCYDNHFNEYDWFMKADDDTFVIVENLKSLLSHYSTDDLIHFGHHFKYLGVSHLPVDVAEDFFQFQGYFAGGAGYVLSKATLRKFVEEGLTNSSMCYPKDDGDEDVRLGGCMRNLKVTHGDSRDEKKLKRFFPFEPKDHLIPSRTYSCGDVAKLDLM